jgi:hypothetical protein
LMDMFSKPDYLIGTKSITISLASRKPTVTINMTFL